MANIYWVAFHGDTGREQALELLRDGHSVHVIRPGRTAGSEKAKSVRVDQYQDRLVIRDLLPVIPSPRPGSNPGGY